MAYDQARYAARSPAAGNIVVDADSSFWRHTGKWSVAFLFFCAMTALLVSLQLFQLTAEGNSKRTLRRAVAALAEIDPLLDRNYDDLRQRAGAIGPGEAVELRDFPVAVPLTKDEVLNSSKLQLRNLLLDRSANIMYAHGSGALRAPNASGPGVGVFSAAGISNSGLGFLRSRNHNVLGVLTFVCAGLCAVLGVTLAALCRGFGRLASVGAVVLAASAPMLLAGIGARFYMRIASGSDKEYIQREFLEIGQGLAWIPIRNGVAFTVLGAALLLFGAGCAVWADRSAALQYRAAR